VVSLVGEAILYVLFLWWFGTGAILFLDGLPRRTFRWTLVAASLVTALAFAALWATKNVVTGYGAVAGFTAAIIAWGFNEVAFLTGVATGPRKTELPAGAKGFARFRYAVEAVIHHELLLAATFLAIVAATWGGENQVGVWTFALLWVMRLSTKFNIFLGVAHNTVGLLPPHLVYLETYFRRRAFNALFPLSVTGATIATVMLVAWASAAQTAHESTAYVLLATLSALALLEHWVLMLPVRFAELWRWGLGDRGRVDPKTTGLERCEVALDAPCDPSGISKVLSDIAAGAFGDVADVTGLAKAGTAWIRFDLVEGVAHMSEIPAAGNRVPRVVAVGRTLDAGGLRAAFEGCAVRAAA
jgi:putative photosynthetic complex assembly protein 2